MARMAAKFLISAEKATTELATYYTANALLLI
jgi:hypothetical protein